MDLDDFDDDDLDTIPDNTLRELEQHALISTQATAAARHVDASNDGPARSGTEIEVDRSIDPTRWQSFQPAQLINGAPQLPSSDYGFDDEDVIDLDEQSRGLQAASNLPSLPPHRRRDPPLDPETAAAFAAADAELGSHVPGQWNDVNSLPTRTNENSRPDSLQARIAQLEAERARLMQSEQHAREALLAKQGEISIVRANQEKSAKEFERRMAVMQQAHADESARHKAELDAGRKEREKMETDNRFLQHDLRQEAERSKRLTGPGKARSGAVSSRRATPQKVKRFAHGDGFEDEEVLQASPSKSKDISREQTPKAGAKRKRAAQDSPLPALSFSQPALANTESEVDMPIDLPIESLMRPGLNWDKRYKFLQSVLNHIPMGEHCTTIELLTRHTLPSDTTKTMSAILLEQLASPVATSEDVSLASHLCHVLHGLWKRCLDDKHYAPLHLIFDLLRFALRLEPSSTRSNFVEVQVPLCTQTVDLVALPVARASASPTYAANLDRAEHDKLTTQIDVDEILDLLQNLCEAASVSQSRIETFWGTMEFSFTLMMLNKAQPLLQIITVLRILATSALEATFGCISNNTDTQATHERQTIDRLTNLLFEVPEVPKNEMAYSEEELVELRIEVLDVLKVLCLTSYGGIRLAQHATAIGKIIWFLDKQVSALHRVRPPLGRLRYGDGNHGLGALESQLSAHELIAKTINTTVMLLYYLLKTYGSEISFPSKTAAVKGGHHCFIVSMTRIAFSDQLVLEAGIDDQTVEAAHTILDEILNPEEGEAIMEAVGTPRGSRTTATGMQSGSTTEIATDNGGEDVAMTDNG